MPFEAEKSVIHAVSQVVLAGPDQVVSIATARSVLHLPSRFPSFSFRMNIDNIRDRLVVAII